MANQKEIDAFFAHHGVKGMHWGVRRAGSSAKDVGRKSSSQAKKSGHEAKAAVKGHPKLLVAGILAGAIGAAVVGSAAGRGSAAFNAEAAGRKLFEDPEFLNSLSNFTARAIVGD